jgi:hypothetical protein
VLSTHELFPAVEDVRDRVRQTSFDVAADGLELGHDVRADAFRTAGVERRSGFT